MLLACYLVVFNLWLHEKPDTMKATGLLSVVLLSVLLETARRQAYFTNFWDGAIHASVILDLLLETVLIPEHVTRDFYLCALGFALVIGTYRAYWLKKLRTTFEPD